MFRPTLIDARNPGPMTGRGNHTYLLSGPDGEAALVDAGVGEPQHLAELERELGGAMLRHVLVTHGHGDHASGAPALARAHAAAVFSKYPWPEEDARHDVEWRRLADGDRIAAGGVELVALHTPGHSPDHVVFWHEASRTAFTGDLVVQGSSVMIHTSRGGDLTRYLAALERLLALDIHTLLPAHGPAVAEPAALLRGYLEHRRLRERQIVAALESGHATVEAIAESIYHGLDPALLGAARENVRAHLAKLRADLLAFDDDGRWHL